MNEENKYLDFTLLEDFCLGLLPENEAMDVAVAAGKFPSVKERIEKIEESLKQALQVRPGSDVKQKIFRLLDTEVKDEIDLSNPPAIDKYSDAVQWNRAVQSLQPLQDFGDIKVHPLLQTPNNEMYVAWVQTSLEEDGHDQQGFVESFLILEGSCECNLGGEMRYLQAGDFLEIPPDIKHSIVSTSKEPGYVKAILQRRKIA